ncbi:hypothetical protein AGMMS49982_22290 [Bacteroidia bacterium]|nr:hypothetical protein AGMMS49982_22290 [Bacteroidia bacterium]
MYHQVLVPSEQNAHIPIPREWYGRQVEVIAFPITQKVTENSAKAKRKKLDMILDPHLVSLKNFKFNRAEANDYH